MLAYLVDYASVGRDIALADVSGSVPRNELQKEADKEHARIESQIKELLGNRYEEYKNYNSSYTERLDIAEISNSAFSQAARLSPEQIDALAGTLDRINSAAPGYSKIPGKESLESRSDRYNQLLSQARSILSPEQYQHFNEEIADRLVIESTNQRLHKAAR
ncbi:MAG: hypothetical protein ABIZ04_17835 [Opitutus sp.]